MIKSTSVSKRTWGNEHKSQTLWLNNCWNVLMSAAPPRITQPLLNWSGHWSIENKTRTQHTNCSIFFHLVFKFHQYRPRLHHIPVHSEQPASPPTRRWAHQSLQTTRLDITTREPVPHNRSNHTKAIYFSFCVECTIPYWFTVSASVVSSHSTLISYRNRTSSRGETEHQNPNKPQKKKNIPPKRFLFVIYILLKGPFSPRIVRCPSLSCLVSVTEAVLKLL